MSKRLQAIATYKSNLYARLSAVNPRLSAELQEVRLPWYTMKNQATEDTSEIYIYDEIGGSFGVQASDFVQELNNITTPNIDIHINSPGGDVFDSIAIYNALYKHPSNITVYVDSLAASGASIIAMGGDEVVMMPGSQLMIHDAMANTMQGNQRDHEGMATFLGRQSDNIAGMYTLKGGGTAESWRELMLAETWMFANEAVDMKLADRVYVKPTDADQTEEIDVAEVSNSAISYDTAVRHLMGQTHDLSGRGYKYTNREVAPAPINYTKAALGMSDIMRAVLKGGKVNA